MLRSLGNTAGHSQPPLLALVLLCGFPLFCAAGSPSPAGIPPSPKLDARIPVAPLGYGPPGYLYLLSRMSFSSLDFIDSNHLLFTFHESRLLRREEAGPLSADDDDQMIRAVVLNVPGGNVSAAADWRMHDRDRYLWPLSSGRFLVRQRNSYWITDASLRLRRWLVSPSRVETTEVSSDGHLVVIENDRDRPESEQSPEMQTSVHLDGVPAPASTRISLLDVDTKVMQAAFQVELPVQLPVTSSGYLAVWQERPEEYAVRFVPFDGSQVTLGKVASTCRPRETFLNTRAVMIESCGPSTPDLYLDTWTTDGKKLWRGRRDGHEVWPTFATSQNGSRFAVGMLQVTHLINLADSLDDEDVKEQMVQVFDSNTGQLLLTTDASPILSAGQNFALSPDGSRFAVLRRGAIEIYEVPAHPPVPGK